MKNFIKILIICILPFEVYAQNTQDGSLNTNNQNSTVDSNNTTNVGAGSGSPSPVMTAVAPSLLSTGTETCLVSISGGVQSNILGISSGTYRQDEECNRRRDAKVLKDLGMSVAAVSRMCQSADVWASMFLSGTPCPIVVNGKLVVGKTAFLTMKLNPDLYIPDYSKNKKLYNIVLGLGESNENTSDSSAQSISEQFRSSNSGGTDSTNE
jgi:hypothetical protein